eukprot:2723542-Pleurochrysis_carterae.AAC.4
MSRHLGMRYDAPPEVNLSPMQAMAVSAESQMAASPCLLHFSRSSPSHVRKPGHVSQVCNPQIRCAGRAAPAARLSCRVAGSAACRSVC